MTPGSCPGVMVGSGASNTFDRSGCVELRGHHDASLGSVPSRLYMDDTLLLSYCNIHAGGVHEGDDVCSRQDANGRIPRCRRVRDLSVSCSIRRKNISDTPLRTEQDTGSRVLVVCGDPIEPTRRRLHALAVGVVFTADGSEKISAIAAAFERLVDKQKRMEVSQGKEKGSPSPRPRSRAKTPLYTRRGAFEMTIGSLLPHGGSSESLRRY